MTLDLEQIKRDREAGTPGPWAWDKPKHWPDYEFREGWLGGIYGSCDGDKTVCDFGDNTNYYPTEGAPPSETNARRIARVPDLEARVLSDAERIADLRAALSDIARQKRTDELETGADVECADFEGGYDACIDRARAALKGERP